MQSIVRNVLLRTTQELGGDASQHLTAPCATHRNFIDDFRTGNPDGLSWTALPEFFRNHGFFTTGDTPLLPAMLIRTDADSELI